MTDRRPLYILGIFLVALVTIVALTRVGGGESKRTEVMGVTVTTSTPPDWQAGMERVTKLENELFANPDPSRVGEMMTVECTCYADVRNRLQALKDKGRHVDGDNLRVESTTLNQQVSEDR